jgi:flagellar biosynthesis/type III secretory pathway protein FliH
VDELMQKGETPEQKKNRNRRLELSRLNQKVRDLEETIDAQGKSAKDIIQDIAQAGKEGYQKGHRTGYQEGYREAARLYNVG